MFYIIYIAVIVFALYLIFHDKPEGDGERRRAQKRPTSTYRPENPGRVPQVPLTPESPMPKPLEPAKPIDPVRPSVRPVTPVEPAKPVRTFDPFRPAGSERELSWGYLEGLEYDEGCGWGVGPDMDTMRTEITGMRYHCSLSDVGPVNGFVKPEPENPHDPNAQVVVRADGKVLGYIPRTALPDYGDFNRRGLTCPFAGRVEVTRQGYLWAEILVALPVSREFVEEELTDYLESGQPEG